MKDSEVQSNATEKRRITIALVGNPNSGKTTLFNAITGARQHVGNWPGVTVEKKEGRATIDGREIRVVDLPGTYSLTAYSIEEIVVRKYIVHERPDVVVHIVDAGNLERNLFLTTQLLELDCRLVLALNMYDALQERGDRVDAEKLGSLLGAPAVPTIGSREQGIRELLKTIVDVADDHHPLQRNVDVSYGHEIEDHLRALTGRGAGMRVLPVPHPARWLAIKLLEKDKEIINKVAESGEAGSGRFLEEAAAARGHLRSIFDDDPEAVITERRYGFVAGILREVFTEAPLGRVSVTEKIDSVLTHKLLGLPVFILMIWLVFQITFTVGAYPMGWLDSMVGILGTWVSAMLGESMLSDLLVDGVINGVGSVMVFLPNIFILFFFISFLEDTGYMARAAFLSDRVMHMLGLHGKAFIPLLMGFGCNVPAIMATRTLESERDRILTILINPLVSCSARLPVYILVAGALFPPEKAGNVIFSIYALGFVLVITMGKLFSKTVLRGDTAPFVMELPPYRLPTMKSSLIHMWDRGKIFLRKMGGVILVGSVLIWTLGAFPRTAEFTVDYDGKIERVQRLAKTLSEGSLSEGGESEAWRIGDVIARLEMSKEAERLEASYIGRIGKSLEPVLRPLGFDWKISVALVSGFVAKEIVVSTLGVLYQSGEDEEEGLSGLGDALRGSGMSPLVGYALMAFVLIYTPCVGTLAAIRRETNSWKWTALSVGYGFVLAWAVAFLIVQGGRLLGLG